MQDGGTMITGSNQLAGRSGSMQSRIALVFIVTAAVAVYACNSGPNSPTSPTPPNNGSTNNPGGAPTGTVKPGVTTLCKVGPGATFLVGIGVNGPNPTTKTVQVDAGQCVDVATVDVAAKDDVIIAIAENATNFSALDHIQIQQGNEAPREVTQTASISFEGSHGAVVTYFNNAVVTLCKQGVTGNFEFQDGLKDQFHPMSLAGGQCAQIAVVPPAALGDDVIVTVRENASSSYRLDHMTLSIGGLKAQTVTGKTDISFEAVHGAVLTFFNVAP
jgi:hypothetical protein